MQEVPEAQAVACWLLFLPSPSSPLFGPLSSTALPLALVGLVLGSSAGSLPTLKIVYWQLRCLKLGVPGSLLLAGCFIVAPSGCFPAPPHRRLWVPRAGWLLIAAPSSCPCSSSPLGAVGSLALAGCPSQPPAVVPAPHCRHLLYHLLLGVLARSLLGTGTGVWGILRRGQVTGFVTCGLRHCLLDWLKQIAPLSGPATFLFCAPSLELWLGAYPFLQHFVVPLGWVTSACHRFLLAHWSHFLFCFVPGFPPTQFYWARCQCAVRLLIVDGWCWCAGV